MTTQAKFPHVCPGAGCAICAWVWLRLSLDEREAPTVKREQPGVTTCQRCGEFRVEKPNGKLAIHRCAA